METGILENVIEIIKLIVPAAAAILAVKYTLKAFTEREEKKKQIDLKIKETEIILPIRLQAYERICMLIERISPQNLIPRVNTGVMSAPQLQQALLSEVRNELNHNLSQQVYISDKAWKLTKQTSEAVKGLIFNAAREMPEGAKGNDLARKILENLMTLDPNPFDTALDLIKSEIKVKL